MPLTAAGVAVPTLVAAVVAAVALAVLARWRDRLPHARPNARTLHALPVPRVAGLSIWAGFAPVALLYAAAVPGGWATLAGVLAVAVVSLIDDWRGVPARTRLAVQLLAGMGVATALLAPDLAAGRLSPPAFAAAAVAATIGLAWAANLFNFMDGSDGLAATMAVAGFAACGIAALPAAAAVPSLAVAAAVLPFLAINVPPARAFMGDVGAVPLGFLAAACGLAGALDGTWPAWFPLLVFLPFVADATVTLARRLLRRERVLEAHRSHYYQRLLQMGAGHRGTLAVYGGSMVGTAASALAALALRPATGWVVLGGWIAAFGLFFAAIDYHWGKHNPASR